MKTAVVIGGGIAGLAAAKVLAPHFKKVTVYDKNEVKHSLHQHVLLKSGQVILEKIFPGVSGEFLKSGCPEIDWAHDTLWENMDGGFPRYPSLMKTLSMSRGYLQELMLAELGSVANVQIVDMRVEKLSDISASLIVIAGGQNFPIQRFLDDVFLYEKRLKINLTYRSYVFNLSDLNMEGFKQYYFQIDPPRSFIGGVICPIEDNKAMVTIIERENKISDCKTFEDFLLKAKGIPGGVFYKIIKNAKPIKAMAVFRKIETYRKVLNANKMPAGVIVIGDALNSLNPVFGQGMTLALKQVEALGSSLADNHFDEKSFHLQCNQLGAIPYFLSQTGSKDHGLLKQVLRFYLKACQRSKTLHYYFLKILHSLGAPRKLA